jgi:uncharacterized membrane protein YsdA (DUF1294 family)
MEQIICKFCGQNVFTNYYFCPYCGKKLIEPPITRIKEISVYLLSVLLPPLGFWPGIKYLLQKNQKSKRVGIIAIVLTIISTVITLYFSIIAFNGISKNINAQLNQTQLQNFGY